MSEMRARGLAGPHISPGSFGLAPFALRRLIGCIEAGRVTVLTPSGGRIEHCAARPGPEAVLVLHRWRAIRRLVTGGNVGWAEAYIDGDWSSPDPATLTELVSVNRDRLEGVVGGLLPVRLVNRLRHLLRANSRKGSRRNIAFHYDLGNDFFRLWLDESLTYSSALFDRPDRSLAEAQRAKLDRIVELLDLRGGERVLEIGCGWGALAAHLGRSGARVEGVTLSAEQLAHGRALVAGQGLADRVELRLQDYREIEGTYDRVVSIEMLEAVGEAYWPAYFQALHDRLAPGGLAVLQAITIDESRFDSYRRGTDFVQRYVFPGGMLPTRSLIAAHGTVAGLEVSTALAFGQSYAFTLAEWRRRFLAAWPEIEALGFAPSFRRLWDYYLAYCEAGFRTGALDVGLYVLRRKPAKA